MLIGNKKILGTCYSAHYFNWNEPHAWFTTLSDNANNLPLAMCPYFIWFLEFLTQKKEKYAFPGNNQALITYDGLVKILAGSQDNGIHMWTISSCSWVDVGYQW